MPKKSGFTLIELLVSMTIIAILATIGFAVYTDSQRAARDAKRKIDLSALVKALEQYKALNGSYPHDASTDSIYYSCWDPNDWVNDGLTDGTSGALYRLVTGGQIKNLPKDPINSQGGAGNYLAPNAPNNLCYIYYSPRSGATFILGTNLETDKTFESGNDTKYGNYQVTNQQ